MLVALGWHMSPQPRDGKFNDMFLGFFIIGVTNGNNGTLGPILLWPIMVPGR